MMPTFTVTNKERAVFIVSLQQFLLGLNSLYFAKVPPKHKCIHNS